MQQHRARTRLEPAIIASLRRHHNAPAIFVFNLFLGWTVLGWILALVWACTYTNNTKTI
jgi:hypothetical protein